MTAPTIPQMTNARLFVDYWIDYKNYTLNEVRANTQIQATLLLDYLDLLSATNVRIRTENINARALKPIGPKVLEAALAEYIQKWELEELKTIADKHRFNPSADPASLTLFIRAVTGHNSTLDTAVMSHWLWCVKRRSYGLPTLFELMPIFVGAQGGGKSQSIRSLTKSWTGAVINVKLTDFADSKMFESFSKNYIAFADELEGAERSDMNALKNQITTTQNSYRALYTHSMKTVPMNCCFIGASNRKIKEVFNDSTGMRRFYEISCQKKLDWDALDKVNYLELWQSIDESKEKGYMDRSVLESLATVQQDLVNVSDVEQFLDEHAAIPKDGNYTVLLLDDLYSRYLDWAALAGIRKPLAKNWFSTRLESTGLTFHLEYRANGSKIRAFHISPNSSLVTKQFATPTVLEFKK